MTDIELRDVALGYGRQAVLRDVNLRLEPGAMVAPMARANPRW